MLRSASLLRAARIVQCSSSSIKIRSHWIVNATAILNSKKFSTSQDILEESTEPSFSIGQLYNHHFFADKVKSVYDVAPGGYVSCDEKELIKYLPEGLAGEIEKDFELTNKKEWMIRESTKVICTILDEFQSKSKAKKDSFITTMSVPNLTDRAEFPDAFLRIKSFNNDLLPLNPANSPTFPVSGPKSSAGTVAEYFKEKNGEMPDKIMIGGDRGTGKSTTLNQAVLHARKSGWLCLFVPKGWDQVQSGSFVEPLPWNENVYDNQLMSVEVLRGFWMAHSEVLKTIPIKNMGIFDKYESHQAAFREAWNRALSVSGRSSLGFIQMRGIVLADDHFPAIDKLDTPILSNFDFLSFKPKTLEDLVRFGVAFTDLSGSVFMDLVEELKQLQEHKVLIAVDQYNTWEAPSAYSYNYKKLYGKDLCVPKALQFICKKKADSEKMKLANGLFICATSFKHTDGLKETFEQMLSSVPLFVKVPYYSQLEFLSSLSALMGSKLLPDDLTIQDILAYRMQTASSPRLIRDELVSFFFQRLSDRNNEQLKALRTATQLKEFNDSNENDASDDGYNGDAISDKSETNGKSEDVSMLVDKLLDRDNRKSMKR